MNANWGENTDTIDSAADLEALIRVVRLSKQPTMVFLNADDGSLFAFGVGHEESILTFVEPDGRSFHSRGDITRKGCLQFLSQGQLDDFLAEMAVPEQLAIHAAKEFLETRTRPSTVTWEADW